MSLDTFIADVTARYPVSEIVLFGSRGCGEPRQGSDWDLAVCLHDSTTRSTYRELLEDRTLQRHFLTFLDLFTVDEAGRWDWPSWTCDESGGRGFFPQNSPWRYDIAASAVTVWAGGAE